MYHVPLAVQCIYGGSDCENGDVEGGVPGLLYADDLVLCGESEEDLRVMLECFAEVCRRGRLKVSASKSKVMECEVCIDGIRLEHLNTWDVFWMNLVLMRQNVVGRW